MWQKLQWFLAGITLVFMEVFIRQRNVCFAYHQDELTGVFNRGAILDLGERVVRAAMREQGQVGLVHFDLDDLKQVNDLHGHAEGDRVLVEFAKALKACLRPMDFAGRLGGDEFLILLPGADLFGAHRVVDRLRAILPHIPFSAGIWTGSLTPARPVTLAQLITLADGEMYVDKSQKKRHRLSV
jgi:diguanylate cyclase (GGDEF)-like protein